MYDGSIAAFHGVLHDSALNFHPPSPCVGLFGSVAPGALVSLNPQPIPPGFAGFGR
jgi:hypothetical protein